jgi:CRP-like cAMP-binding protein
MDKNDIINGIYEMPEASVDKLAHHLTAMSLPRGSYLLQAGKIERNVFLIAKGIVRAFLPVDGKEITFWIGAEGAAVVSLNSYVNGKCGYETVECLEDTDLYRLKRDELDEMFREDINIANWGRRFAEMEFLKAEEKFTPLLFTTATERYEAFIKNHPDILQRISLEHLASYLGITPVSLSRIRAIKK